MTRERLTDFRPSNHQKTLLFAFFCFIYPLHPSVNGQDLELLNQLPFYLGAGSLTFRCPYYHPSLTTTFYFFI